MPIATRNTRTARINRTASSRDATPVVPPRKYRELGLHPGRERGNPWGVERTYESLSRKTDDGSGSVQTFFIDVITPAIRTHPEDR